MIYCKTEEDILKAKESSDLVSRTLAEVAKAIKPGVTSLELDKIAEEFILSHGARPAFKGYNKFPNTLCTSINEAVVHGIPGKYSLKEGDIISIDCGVEKQGFFGDVAYTFEVGEVKDEIKKLLRVTLESLEKGIEKTVVGNRIGDIGYAVQKCAESAGFGVVRDLVGHGLGESLHEAPEVPNFGKQGRGIKLKEGMILAIEPMINLGTKSVSCLDDKWTIVTADKKPSAHYEHNVVVRKGKPEVLSTYEYIHKVINK